MKRITSIIIGILAVLIAFWLGYFISQQQINDLAQQETIKIGAILPFTGKLAIWGETSRNGINLALDEINSNGGINGKLVEVIYEDNQTDVKIGVSAYSKLVNIDKVIALISMSSSQARALSPLVKGDQVPLIVNAVGLTDVTVGNDYLFRIWPSGKDKAVAMEKGMEEFRNKKIAVISANNDSPLDLLEQFKKEVLVDLNIEIAIEEVIAKDETDLRTSLAKIKAMDFDGLFINLYSGQIGLGIKQARELGISVPIFSNNMAESIEEINLAGGAMEGVWFPGPPNPLDDFKEKYQSKYNQDPERLAAPAYDAMQMYFIALEKAEEDGTKIKDELYNIHDYHGAYGNILFDDDGNVALPLPLIQVKNGEFIGYK